MKRSLLLSFAAMLFGMAGSYAQLDTVWVSNRYCSTENIAVSPDERFVVTWGNDGWRFDPDHPDGENNLGNPAKVFDAQTGEWLESFFDENIFSDVYYVNFSPDNRFMLISIGDRVDIYEISGTADFSIFNTIYANGAAVFSPDMSILAVGKNFYTFENDVFTWRSSFDYKIETYETGNPNVAVKESAGIFRKDGEEFVFTYEWYTQTLPFSSEGSGMAVIDLKNSTITLTPGVPFSQWYYRYGTDYYSAIETKMEDNYTYTVRDQLTDSLIWQKNFNYFVKPMISATGEYCTIGSRTFLLPDTIPCCQESIRYPKELGNDFVFASVGNGNYKLYAVRPCCIFTSIPPKVLESINTYPVPTNGKLNMILELKDGDYTAEVVDMKGNTIKIHNLGYQQEGNEKLEIDTSDLPIGTYMVIIRSENEAQTVKIIKN